MMEVAHMPFLGAPIRPLRTMIQAPLWMMAVVHMSYMDAPIIWP
jgi:hypothetical protein